ncbi:MAG TPA: DUF4271 domain-containing protein [Bacteroidales bacterium]|nr:DUF4271 domain-containing protein [Bacteroidales bacterium]
MIIRYLPEYIQDSLPRRINIIQDTLNSGPDSLSAGSNPDTLKTERKLIDSVLTNNKKTESNAIVSKQVGIVTSTGNEPYDTTSVCIRNSVADVTFHNPDFVLSSIDQRYLNQFPYRFTENNLRIKSERKALLEMHLRSGEIMPEQMFHDNWVFGILIFALIFFSVVQSTTKSFSPAITRFFLFRGTNEEGTRDMMGIFQWQTTILNLSSFMVIALYSCFAASYFHIIPDGITYFLAWLIALGVIIVSVTLRHIVCFFTGLLSNQRAVFHDYVHTVYQSYRFGAFFIFILVIMMLYTSILPDGSYFLLGAFIIGILLIIRILRLFMLFINRNTSIFYLILYLCALEILPVLITIKYFSGLA